MAATRPASPHAGAAWIVILAGVSAALHVGKLPPALPVLQGELGITLVQAGFLLSLVQLASMTLGIVAGLITRPTIGIGALSAVFNPHHTCLPLHPRYAEMKPLLELGRIVCT